MEDERNLSKQPPPAPTARAVDPCPTIIQIRRRLGTGTLPSTIAPAPFEGSEHRSDGTELSIVWKYVFDQIYNVKK